MTAPRCPSGLKSGGKALWAGVATDYDLESWQLATLEQACRQRDRADSLAIAAAAGDPGALRHERDSALAMTRLITALRLPDAQTGKKPQYRGPRGVQKPSIGKVSSLDKARARSVG